VLLLIRRGHVLFAVAAGVVLLLFVGIHNAWDIVTFIATGRADEPVSEEAEPAIRRIALAQREGL